MSKIALFRDGATLALVFAGLLLPASAQSQTADVSPSGETVVLNPFVVTDSGKGYIATNTISGTAMNTLLRDVPMTINVITSELVEDMAPIDLQDVMKINSSVTQTNRHPVVNRTASWSIRGFLNRNVLVNGVRAADLILPQMIDRIEVVKGPNTLYGQSDPGGLINIITKRPLARQGGTLRASVGDYGSLTGDLDFNLRLADDAVGLRLLTGYNETDGFRRVDGRDQKYAGLMGEIKIRENTTINIDAMGDAAQGIPAQRSVYPLERIPTDLNGDGVIDNTIVRGVTESTARYNSPDIPADFTSATRDSRYENDHWYLGLGIRHVFNSYLSAQYNYVDTQQFQEMHFREFNTFEPRAALGGTLASDAAHYWQKNVDTTDAHTLQTALTFDTGGISHRFLVGARSTRDYLEQKITSLRTLGPAGERAILDSMIANGRKIRLYLTKSDALSPAAPHNNDETPTAAELQSMGTLLVNQRSRTDVDSFYITDSIGLMENRLKVLAGLRYVDIGTSALDASGNRVGLNNQRSDSSYQLGVSYNLTDRFTLFANTATAFNPNGLNSLTGDFFEPEESTAFEAGLKFENLWHNRIGGSIALFEINKENVVRSDFNPVTFGQTVDITDDESKGIDVELFLNLTDSWQLIAGYSHLQAEVVKGATSAKGLRLEGAAPDKFTLWTTYGVDSGALRGLRFGGGVVYVNGPVQQYGNSVNRLIYEDGYTEVNLFARYKTKIGAYPVTLGLNVSNLTDIVYLQSRGGTNNPRQVILSSTLEF